MDTFIDRESGQITYLGVKRNARVELQDTSDPLFWKYTWPFIEEQIEGKLKECAEVESTREFADHLKLSHHLDREGLILSSDFAPLSFTFRWKGMFGGIIFHGRHDRGGDGGAPTFSVSLSPVDGWAMHT